MQEKSHLLNTPQQPDDDSTPSALEATSGAEPARDQDEPALDAPGRVADEAPTAPLKDSMERARQMRAARRGAAGMPPALSSEATQTLSEHDGATTNGHETAGGNGRQARDRRLARAARVLGQASKEPETQTTEPAQEEEQTAAGVDEAALEATLPSAPEVALPDEPNGRVVAAEDALMSGAATEAVVPADLDDEPTLPFGGRAHPVPAEPPDEAPTVIDAESPEATITLAPANPPAELSADIEPAIAQPAPSDMSSDVEGRFFALSLLAAETRTALAAEDGPALAGAEAAAAPSTEKSDEAVPPEP
ncbi:MAG TPA: hypothetical protein VF099_15515, partial [Ktedonobacterales bacterium]